MTLGGSELVVGAGAVETVGPAWLVLRPEVIRLSARPGTNGPALTGTVQDVAFRGAGFSYRIEVPALEELLKVETAAEGGIPYELGSEVVVTWDRGSCSLLPRT